jgi:fructokinase
MKLIFNKDEFQSLLTNLQIEKTVSGGSVANSIVGLSQLGNEVGFIGKISDDNFGAKYEEGLKKENVAFLYSKKKRKSSYWYLFNFSYARLRTNYVYIFRHSRKNK